MKNELQGLVQTNTSTGASSKTIRDTILMYLYYWPLFLISLFIGLGLGYIKLRYTVPMYAANTVINVKGETTTSKGSSGGSGDLITSAMQGGRSVINLDNELGRLRSARLMTQVVRNSDLNISYYRSGRFIDLDIYHEAPFRLIPKEIQDSSQSISFSVTKLNGTGATILYGSEENPVKQDILWNQPFRIYQNTYSLTTFRDGFGNLEKYTVRWNPTLVTVYELLPKVSVNVIGKTSNIALSATMENQKRGEDVLNRMVNEFIQMNLEDQNRYAQDKIYFIEDRLGKISDELKGVEKNLASFQGNNLLVGNDANTRGTPIGEAEKGIDQIRNQKMQLNMIRNALASGTTLPTGGISDGTLNGLVGSYNNLLLKRQTTASQVAPNSMILKDIDEQISNVKAGIQDNLAANLKTLDMQVSTFAKQSSQFRSSVSVLPEMQRIMKAAADNG
ncbi:MAG: hypothetical protein EOO04_30730, partial [Chitinophagaceae bacterium]